MTAHTQRRSRWFPPLLTAGSLLTVLLLTACSLGGTIDTTSTPTPSPIPTPTLTAFTGNGFTIGYPRGWNATRTVTGVIITAPDGITSLSVTVVPDPDGIISPSGLISTTLQTVKTAGTSNFKVVNVPPTVTVAGESWNEGAATATGPINGKTVTGKFVALADIHPAASSSTKLFTILYGADVTMFDQINSTDFQPTLQSFRFT